MPRKPKMATEAQTALPSIPKELIDQFVKGPMTAMLLEKGHKVRALVRQNDERAEDLRQLLFV
jgi:hypothetical protein